LAVRVARERFWLYVVTGAKTAARFRVGEDIEVTGYIIQEEAWQQQIRSQALETEPLRRIH
jgi:hypothetical protein